MYVGSCDGSAVGAIDGTGLGGAVTVNDADDEHGAPLPLATTTPLEVLISQLTSDVLVPPHV